MISAFKWKVKHVERELKHKIRPENAFHECVDFDFIMSCPKEDLNQLFIRLYGEHIIPASFYQYPQVLRRPDLVIGETGNGIPKYLVTNKMLGAVWMKSRIDLRQLNQTHQ